MEARHVQFVGHGNVPVDQQLGDHDVKGKDLSAGAATVRCRILVSLRAVSLFVARAASLYGRASSISGTSAATRSSACSTAGTGHMNPQESRGSPRLRVTRCVFGDRAPSWP